MALVRPYPLTLLADRLKIKSVVFDDHRNDNISGSGDGRVWPAELADPLWTADVECAPGTFNEVKQIAALIRALKGSQESFWLYDPISRYPQADPTGSILGAAPVQVSEIPSNRNLIRFKGLPSAYTLTLGDKAQITTTTRSYFCEVIETVTANTSGVTTQFEVYPAVPLAVAVNDPVTLVRPACKMFIWPGSFTPGKSVPFHSADLKFKAMERVR